MSGDPHYVAKVNQFFPIAVSVSSPASAAAAGVGPFVGLMLKVSSSFTIIGIDGTSLIVNDAPATKNLPAIWIQGAYLGAINASAATATATAGSLIIYGVR